MLALTYANHVRHRLADMEKDRERLMAVARVHDGRRGAKPRQPHINLLIYQYVRGVTIIQVKSKRSAIWKTDMDQYRFSSK